jgi:acyl CoA:acetate/3-ketoacid CoA transferase alpha subunit
MTAAEVVAQLRSGMTIGIGGWGPRRKPMALVREILRSKLRDFTVVAYGGPDVGMLCAAGKVTRLQYGFVSLDAIPLEPYFRKAREAGAIEAHELDEGMLQWGLRAAAMRIPFLPTRVGLGTDVMTHNPEFRTVQSPYADGEVLLAMPALHLDAALIHVDDADRLGNTQIHSPDPFFDDLFARAAERCFVSCEHLFDRLDLARSVVHSPLGAHPTSCAPQYGWDIEHLRHYCATAGEEGGWDRYTKDFLSGGEADYIAKVGGPGRIAKLPMPVL